MKNADRHEIIRAVYAVHETGYYFNDLVNKILLIKLTRKGLINPVFTNVQAELTDQEKEVLQLFCSEETLAGIEKKLDLDTAAVTALQDSLMKKTGVRNLAGLAMYAAKHDLVQ